MQPQGFNIGLNLGQAAGAGLPGHLHWHVVPRYPKEGLAFMHTIGNTNVIAWDLTNLYTLLRPAFNTYISSQEENPFAQS